MDRDYFPRGGAKERPVIQFKKFVFEKNKIQKRSKKKKFHKSPPKSYIAFPKPKVKEIHTHLKYADIGVGFQSICAVHSIFKDRLLVNLPYEMRAFVHYSSISRHYSQNIDSQEEMNLHQMFHIGQLLSCKVVKGISNDKPINCKVKAYVTTEPAAVNWNLNSGMINEHSMIQMAVSSIEDRGYMMDSGIAGILAFLPFEQAVKYLKNVFANKRKNLQIGTILWCYIVKCTENSSGGKFVEVRVCHNAAFVLESNNSASILWPGSRVDTTITKVFDDGCYNVLVDGTDIQGTVNAQLDFKNNPSQPYFEGSNLKATVMTYNPLSYAYSFSSSHYVYKPTHEVDRAYKQICVGTVDHLNKFVIYISLKDKTFKGIASVKALLKTKEDLNDDTKEPAEIDYKPGDHVKVEIMNIDLIKNKYMCNIVKKINSEEFQKFTGKSKKKICSDEKVFLSDDENVSIKSESESDSDFELDYNFKINENLLSETQEDSGIETSKPKENNKSKKEKNIKKSRVSVSAEDLSDVKLKKESDSEMEVKEEKLSDSEENLFNHPTENSNASSLIKLQKKKSQESVPDHLSLKVDQENKGSRKRKNKPDSVNSSDIKKIKKNNANFYEAANDQKDLNVIAQLSLQHVDTEYLWDATPEDLAKATSKHLEEFEEEFEDEEKSTKPLSKKQKKKNEIEKERLIQEKEEELLKALEEPKSADHYERLILSRPDDSKVWIKYMAFHLESIEIEKARAVGNRALKLINHRNEQDRLNVWLALLNLEHLYGSKELFKETWSEALKYNDDFKVNCKVLEMYVGAQNTFEVIHLVQTMVKKYKDNLECWYACLSALMSVAMEEKARDFLQRALKYFPPKNHVTLISRFALLENSCGHNEEAQALFDNLLTSYPARIDLWFVYVDMLIKSSQIEIARQVLERTTSLKLPAKKMKSLYKKWLDFEEKHGSQESVETVRKSATEYVERATKEMGS